MLNSAKMHMLKHNININGDLLLKKMMIKYHKNRKNQLLRRFIIKRAKTTMPKTTKIIFASVVIPLFVLVCSDSNIPFKKFSIAFV